MSTPDQMEIYPMAKPLTLSVCERPRNRAKAFGPAALSDVEIVALMLGAGEKPEAEIVIARSLVEKFGSLGGMAGKSTSDFAGVAGVGERRANSLAAALEIGRRVAMESAGESPMLDQAHKVCAFMAPRIAGLEVEKFFVLCLNRKNRLLKCVEISSGTATSACAHPREVFRAALREGATAIICVHNHPSGDPAPSANDMVVTRALQAAGKAVDIAFVDHVVIGRAGADPLGKGYFSFRESGII